MIIDYDKLSNEELIELRDIMKKNLITLEAERDLIVGQLADKQEELRQLEELEMLIGLAENAIEYLEERIK